MIELLPDNEISQEYITYAAFYDVQLNIQTTWRFRRLLQIYKLSFDQFGGENHLADKVEATFIMMNPGRAEPFNQLGVPNVQAGTSFIPSIPMVCLTHPDKAQYQIMRLMKLKNWKSVQVINLSDIKSPSSTNFYSMCKNFENLFDDSHSIRHSEYPN
jgi:hypothetical protein